MDGWMFIQSQLTKTITLKNETITSCDYNQTHVKGYFDEHYSHSATPIMMWHLVFGKVIDSLYHVLHLQMNQLLSY
jgi:hypothetical protein